jgi:hypothetical protein
MRNALFTALLLGLVPNLAGALEVKNVRPTYGVNGALRGGPIKLFPGDFIYLSYDLEGLSVDPKTGKVEYDYSMDVYDSSEKKVYGKGAKVEMILQLGGNRSPGSFVYFSTEKQTPGKYTIKLTFTDQKSKETKAITYPFELVKEDFGFVGIIAPGVILPGQDSGIAVHLVNMGLDKKNEPNVEITLNILDEAGKAVIPPLYNSFPKDLPANVNLAKQNFVPLTYPLTPNRPGRFTIEITAKDKVATKEAHLRYTLTVVDVAAMTAK